VPKKTHKKKNQQKTRPQTATPPPHGDFPLWCVRGCRERKKKTKRRKKNKSPLLVQLGFRKSATDGEHHPRAVKHRVSAALSHQLYLFPYYSNSPDERVLLGSTHVWATSEEPASKSKAPLSRFPYLRSSQLGQLVFSFCQKPAEVLLTSRPVRHLDRVRRANILWRNLGGVMQWGDRGPAVGHTYKVARRTGEGGGGGGGRFWGLPASPRPMAKTPAHHLGARRHRWSGSALPRRNCLIKG